MSVDDTVLGTNINSMLRPANYEVDQSLRGSRPWEDLAWKNREVLRQAFHDFDRSAALDKFLIDQLFETKDYEAHSPLLRRAVSSGSIPSPKTLLERTKGLVSGA